MGFELGGVWRGGLGQSPGAPAFSPSPLLLCHLQREGHWLTDTKPSSLLISTLRICVDLGKVNLSEELHASLFCLLLYPQSQKRCGP